MECNEIKQECLKTAKWLRLPFMLIFAVSSYFIMVLVWIMALFQFVYHLITGNPCNPLVKFSATLSEYIANIVSYLCYNDDKKPFPFSEWPNSCKTKQAEKTEKHGKKTS